MHLGQDKGGPSCRKWGAKLSFHHEGVQLGATANGNPKSATVQELTVLLLLCKRPSCRFYTMNPLSKAIFNFFIANHLFFKMLFHTWLVSSFLIDLLAILQQNLDRAIFLYKFIREVRKSGVTALIAVVHIRKFYKL